MGDSLKPPPPPPLRSPPVPKRSHSPRPGHGAPAGAVVCCQSMPGWGRREQGRGQKCQLARMGCRPPLPEDAIEHIFIPSFAGPPLPSFPACISISVLRSVHRNPQPPFPLEVGQLPAGRRGLALRIQPTPAYRHCGPGGCAENVVSIRSCRARARASHGARRLMAYPRLNLQGHSRKHEMWLVVD